MSVAKGNAEVIIDKSSYVVKIDQILSDQTKGEDIAQNNPLKVIISKEDRLKKFLQKPAG